MRLKFLFISFIFILSTGSGRTEESVGNVCKLPQEFLKEPITPENLLINLFVRFNHDNKKGKKMKFTAKPVALAGGVITFDDPRLDGVVINDKLSKCKTLKKNIFGYEVCQEMEVYSIADNFCKQLGLEGAVGEGTREVVRSTKESYNYTYSEGKWDKLRLHSMLAPPIKFSRLKSVSCKTGI